jgi:hypothetical protein
MSDSTITVYQQGGYTKLLDTEGVTNGNGQSVDRQRMTILPNSMEIRLDWYNPGDNVNHVRYEGFAAQGAATSQPQWTIKQFTWVAGPISGNYVLTDVQVLFGVVWDNRVNLGWHA